MSRPKIRRRLKTLGIDKKFDLKRLLILTLGERQINPAPQVIINSQVLLHGADLTTFGVEQTTVEHPQVGDVAFVGHIDHYFHLGVGSTGFCADQFQLRTEIAGPVLERDSRLHDGVDPGTDFPFGDFGRRRRIAWFRAHYYPGPVFTIGKVSRRAGHETDRLLRSGRQHDLARKSAKPVHCRTRIGHGGILEFHKYLSETVRLSQPETESDRDFGGCRTGIAEQHAAGSVPLGENDNGGRHEHAGQEIGQGGCHKQTTQKNSPPTGISRSAGNIKRVLHSCAHPMHTVFRLCHYREQTLQL